MTPREHEDHEEIDALVERVTRALDVPEPSPLFWEHFSERVRAATALEQPEPPAAPAWWRRHAMGLSLATALVAGVAIWAVAPLPSAGPSAPAATAVPAVDDGAWSMVSASAESSSIEALREAGFTVRRGGADAAIEELTEAERAAFAAILEAEMKRGGQDGL